jgi:hypothetical protein
VVEVTVTELTVPDGLAKPCGFYFDLLAVPNMDSGIGFGTFGEPT